VQGKLAEEIQSLLATIYIQYERDTLQRKSKEKALRKTPTSTAWSIYMVADKLYSFEIEVNEGDGK
jgi:hypothetical protein